MKSASLRCKNCFCGVNGKPGLPGCFYMEDDYEKTLTQKQIADYEQLYCDRNNGRLLIQDGPRFICEANNYAPEAIDRQFLEVLAKMGRQ